MTPLSDASNRSASFRQRSYTLTSGIQTSNEDLGKGKAIWRKEQAHDFAVRFKGVRDQLMKRSL
jgi:hypothetical protein